MGCNGICGTCVWHENFNGTTDWICSNEDSDSYGAVTSYDDYCIDYEPKKNELNYTINFQLYHLTKDDYVKISVSPIFYTFTILFLLE